MKEFFNKYILPINGAWLIFLAAMLWASDAPFRVGLVENLPTELIVMVEHIISLLVLSFFIPATIRKLRQLKGWKSWLLLIVISVGGSAGALLLFTSAFSYMNPSVVIVLQKLQPVIGISLAVIFLGERLSRTFWFWASIIIASAYLLSFPELVPRVFVGEEFNPNLIGAGLAIGASVLWASSTVAGRSLLNHFDFKTLTTARFLLATIFLVILNLATGTYKLLPAIQTFDWISLLVISITSGSIAVFIYYRGLQTTRASVSSLAELGFPVAAVVVNYLFLDAVLSVVQLGAIVLILLAVFRLSKLKS